jgi:phosphate transport system substrate-binding protein
MRAMDSDAPRVCGRSRALARRATVLVSLAALAGCGAGVDARSRSGYIAIDGSSTVFPITEAVAEDFRPTGRARVTIGVSGTGGGFKKLCLGEITMAGASRPIKPVEAKHCAETGIPFIELPVAYDGIVVVVHPDNHWVDALTVDELRRIWSPESQATVTRWSQVRPGWPDEELHLFGAGVDSGTYDYFTRAVVGREHASRGDYTSSEDDNVLVQGIATDPLALGFFGFAYYAANVGRLKAVPIDDGERSNGAGPVAASVESIRSGTYQPLSRPVFLYVAGDAAERDDVRAFVHHYMRRGGALAEEVGYVPLPERAYELARARFDRRAFGSTFSGGAQVGVSMEELLSDARP